MHPAECEAMWDAWDQKQKRERIRDAATQHVIALAGGMKKKGGGQLTLDDFAPELKEKSPEHRESRLKAQLMALAANSKRKANHGQ